jgi:Glycosyl hydrolases family 15
VTVVATSRVGQQRGTAMGHHRRTTRRWPPRIATAIIEGDVPLAPSGLHDLVAQVRVAAGQRLRLSLRHVRPEVLDGSRGRPPGPAELDRRLAQTVAWWRSRSARGGRIGHDQPALLRSAMVLKALTQATTGAIAAAATTSLPEAPGGPRNWDYRASWVRDSVFALRSLAELGYTAEADGFRRFVQRSAAGSAQELQIMYGLGGERRRNEQILDHLEGYGGARPVRIGNAAARQHQHDVYRGAAGPGLGLAPAGPLPQRRRLAVPGRARQRGRQALEDPRPADGRRGPPRVGGGRPAATLPDPDGLDGAEGTFVACTFWLAECLARQGRNTQARTAFTRASATANDLGLFAEEFDPATGTLLGNFPQALTHCPTSRLRSPSNSPADGHQWGRGHQIVPSVRRVR